MKVDIGEKMLEYRSVSDLNLLIVKNLHRFNIDLDLIVGIPRSGMLPATLLAVYLNLPLIDLDAFVSGNQSSGGWRMDVVAKKKQNEKATDKPPRILVIDDSVGGGRAMSIAKAKIEAMGTKPGEIIYAACYAKSEKCPHVDIVLEGVKRPVFEWNIMNHMILTQACVDIDGVLCRDPSREEDDDGANYEDFIKSVEPLPKSLFRIGRLVTCRLEKYRKLTEEWLAKHQIEYDHLVMLDLPSKKDRIERGCDAEYKAKALIESKAKFFIESSHRLALQIARISKKPVFCYETKEMLYYDSIDRVKRKETIRLFPRRVVGWIIRLVKKVFRNMISFFKLDCLFR